MLRNNKSKRNNPNNKLNMKNQIKEFLEIEQNMLDIKKMQLENKTKLDIYIDSLLKTGDELIDPKHLDKGLQNYNGMYLKYITNFNKLTMVCVEDPISPEVHKIRPNNYNSEYIKVNPNSKFFVTENSITEINFKDTLEVTRTVELKNTNIKDMYVFEVVFKSARVKNRGEKIIRNKFRFCIYESNNKVTCRRLNE